MTKKRVKLNEEVPVIGEKIFFITPEILVTLTEKGKSLPKTRWRDKQYNYYYIIHKIIHHLTITKGDTNGCRINMKVLGELFAKPNSQVSEIIKNLIAWKIIYVSHGYSRNNTSKGYLICNGYSLDNIIRIKVTSNDIDFINKLIIRDISILENDRFLNKSLNILKSYVSINESGINHFTNKYSTNILSNDGYLSNKTVQKLSKTGFLDEKLLQKVQEGCVIERQDLVLYSIYKGDFYCVRPKDKNKKDSRVYNNLTNLPREHRQFINFDGKPLLMTDISNSQILLTIPLLKKHYAQSSGIGYKGLPDDILRFQKLAETGLFYEELAKMLNKHDLTQEERKEFKEEVFKELWFGKVAKYSSDLKKCFKNRFPNVYEIINKIKASDYTQFAIKLQEFESQIMIDSVAKKMVKAGKNILTLHDAIVTNNIDDMNEAETLISLALEKYGVVPKFKREEITKINVKLKGAILIGKTRRCSIRPADKLVALRLHREIYQKLLGVNSLNFKGIDFRI